MVGHAEAADRSTAVPDDVQQLSASAQNYLKVIWGLQEWTDEPVTASMVGARIGLSAGAVSDSIRRMTAQGLLTHERYGSIGLTGRGRTLALQMVRRHRLLECFLVESLHYAPSEVHEEAESLEHAVSDRLIGRIDAFLDYPKRDPHGDPIPRSDGTVAMPRAHPLKASAPGDRVIIERISDADGALLEYLGSIGISVGTRVAIEPSEPFSDAMTLDVGGRSVQLGEAAVDSVWVSDTQTGRAG